MSAEKNNEKCAITKMSEFRRFLSQFAATTIENMLLFDMGLCNTFPLIVIPALTGIFNDHNMDEALTLTPVQASWLGSIGYIFEPLGSVLSALITDHMGRKSAMMIVNLPLLVAWFMMHNASSVWEVFVGVALLGLGAGLMESPIISYVGEICEPKYRSIMIAYTHVGWTLGMLVVSVLNTFIPWRTVALVCMFVPAITAIALCFIPETPLWLLSKNRVDDAEKALRWLRGWVPKESVAQELQELQRYSERYKSCNLCVKQNQKCSHPLPTTVQKLQELKRKQTMKPFIIVMSLFVIAAFSGAWYPFVVQIFKAYESPIAPDKAAALLSIVNNVANLVFLCLIRFTGKRYMYLTMLSGAFLCSFVICCYGFFVLPSGFNSFDHTQTFSLENKQLGYIPFICILVWSFCLFCGVSTMPWQMVSEVFPYKSRGMATGLTAAINYVLSFIASKSYYNLETGLSMPGIAFFNCVVMAFGLILMCQILPETENRTLEDIEMHFSDNSKKLTDRKISKVQLNEDEMGNVTNNNVKNSYENGGFAGDN